jgi:hypothetical protein
MKDRPKFPPREAEKIVLNFEVILFKGDFNMDESKRPLPESEWKSPAEKLWDILMFRTSILPTLLRILNILAPLLAIFLTVAYLFGKLFWGIPVIWIYVIILRAASELIMLLYDFLIQRTQIR